MISHLSPAALGPMKAQQVRQRSMPPDPAALRDQQHLFIIACARRPFLEPQAAMRPEGLPIHRRPLGRRVQRHQCRQRRRSQTSPSTTRNKASNTGRRGLSVRKPRQTCARTSCAWFVRRQMPCAKEPLLRSASSSSVVEMSPTAPARASHVKTNFPGPVTEARTHGRSPARRVHQGGAG